VDARPIDVYGHSLIGKGEFRNRDEPPDGLNRVAFAEILAAPS
jgi:hypothetical protein